MAAGRTAGGVVTWREGSKGRQRSRFVALRIRPAGITPGRQATASGAELPVRWLLAEWPARQRRTVVLAVGPALRDPLAALVRLAKLRWRIEHDYREIKHALGLDHFEGRTWGGWHHHVTLVSAAHAF